ncbi:MAG: TatD family hydrolase, partial [Lachnospiraceae bacterium]|nr:TatD family hydrolase [Lachnospiraceae bacterium]
MKQGSWEMFGAHVLRTAPGFEQTVFRLYAPGAVAVFLELSENEYPESVRGEKILPFRSVPGKYRSLPMVRSSEPGLSDVFELWSDADQTGERYHFRIRTPEGKDLLRSDPYGTYFPDPAGLDAEVISERTPSKELASIRAERRKHFPGYDKPLVIYEVHPGSWRRHEDGTVYSYDELARELVPYVKDLGFTAIELMGIAEYPSDASWGYQVRGYYAPTSRYGRPSGFAHLVEAAHQAGLAVILDWVGGHFSLDEGGLSLFAGAPLYERVDAEGRPLRTGWGSAPFDFDNPYVRRFLLENALFWEQVYHVDGLRVDAVSVMIYGDPVTRGEMSEQEMKETWAREAAMRRSARHGFDSGSGYYGSSGYYGGSNYSGGSEGFGGSGYYGPVSSKTGSDKTEVTSYDDKNISSDDREWRNDQSDLTKSEANEFSCNNEHTNEGKREGKTFSLPEPDPSAVSFLKELTETTHQSGSHMVLFAEESAAYPGVTRKVSEGGLGFDYKWDLGWMHDFLSYYGAGSENKKWEDCHRQVTFPMMYRDSEQFLLPISHDEVVYGKCSMLRKAPFAEDSVRYAALKTAMGFWMAHPGKKLLFMGQEFGVSKEWDHEGALFEGMLPDGSFGNALQQDYAAFFRDLLTLYRETPVLWRYEDLGKCGSFEHFRWLRTDDTEHGVFAFARFSEGERSQIWIFHFQEDSVAIDLPVLEEGVYRKVLDIGGALRKKGIMHLSGHDDLGRPCLKLTMSGLGLVVYEWNCSPTRVLLTDTHAHYDDDAFDEDRDVLLGGKLKAAGVGRIVDISAAFPSLEHTIALADRYEEVYATCGLHPSDVWELRDRIATGSEAELMTENQFLAWQNFLASSEAKRRSPEELLGSLAEVRRDGLLFHDYLFTGREREIFDHTLGILMKAAEHPKVVAIGEIGLDYHWHQDDLPAQKAWFAAQTVAARELGLPLVIHSRDAAQDTFELLEGLDAGSIGGVMHCYSYKWEMALEYVKCGFFIGIGGSSTYGRAKHK